ncbi:VOC family protein [Bacillus sp. B1-b2]|uniref:VOC family protein n=1 Tax=Bacillus sp. B1-b2 TaxID=2653201 RepID=UPI00126196FE|nr:VOC family protein [Bacillus sp. B1-b2]KAB7672071.1 VOC family protein [Bacillus sp. B1-b2]
MTFQSKNIFINLPVKDVKKSTEFFQSVGFEINLQFTNEDTTCLIVSDNIFVLLLSESRFKDFTTKEIVDAVTSAQAIYCLSAESREQVDELVNKAFAAGGKPSSDKQDHSFMYGWGFQDLDGYLWEVAYMDESKL